MPVIIAGSNTANDETTTPASGSPRPAARLQVYAPMKSMPSSASRSFVSRDHTECMAIGSIASRSRRAGDASCTGGGTAPAGEGTKNALMTSSYVTDRHHRTATRDWATWGCSPRTCSGWCASNASASSPRSTPMARRTCRRRAPPTCGTAITCGSPTSARRGPWVAVNVVDPFVRTGYRFKGPGSVHDAGTDVFVAGVERMVANGSKLVHRVEHIVLIEVRAAAAVTSPAYDD